MSYRHNKDHQRLVKYYQLVERTLVGGENSPILSTPTNPFTIGKIRLKHIRSNDRIELIASVDWGFIARASISVTNPFLSLINFDQTVRLSIIRNNRKVIYQTTDTASTLLSVSPSTSKTPLTSSQIFRTTTFKCNDSNVITCDCKATYTLTIQALTPAITLISSALAEPTVDFLTTTFSVFAFNIDGKVINENTYNYHGC
ncbi:hypothetical protein [Bacillus thuringiensis]|uniref:Uncharacterized protein n=1 Tax=Bacillus thuringiensis Bt18247 TaxID=1423143 RepID=A0A9W3SPJ5_BACTU|nr:hypothetical protein [Bacillus thuringiensis]AOM09279.1 hypothetical protein BTI247_08450 [Bacillus thuringiensis Bt18247]MBG9526538.1 hypothetical protein [Bacillus thuringiensis]